MKTKFILGGMLAIASLAHAQTWGGSTTQTGNTYRTGNVGIGTTSPSTPLNIFNTVSNFALIAESYNPGNSSAIYGEAVGNTSPITTGVSKGVQGSGSGNLVNYGGYFYGWGNGGGLGCPAGSQAVGVYGTIVNGCTSIDYAGLFDGNVNINGQANCTSGLWTSSDQKLKRNITAFTNGLDKIKLLKPSTYTFRVDEFKTMNLPKEDQLGLIAQDLEKVFPQLVMEVGERKIIDKDGNISGTVPSYKTINYVGLIPVLISGMQEQQSTIDKQQQQINELKAMVQSLVGASDNGLTSRTLPASVSLSDKNTIVLNQNVPNPFAESTVISYNIPADFEKAQIVFTMLDGKVIRVIDITQKGPGSLNVFADDLTRGTYAYSLVVDGKTIDTKKMIKE